MTRPATVGYNEPWLVLYAILRKGLPAIVEHDRNVSSKNNFKYGSRSLWSYVCVVCFRASVEITRKAMLLTVWRSKSEHIICPFLNTMADLDAEGLQLVSGCSQPYFVT